MALSSTSVFNPLSLSLGGRVRRKCSAAEVLNHRLESLTSLRSPSPSSSSIQVEVVGRYSAWTYGTWKSQQGRRLARNGMRRLIVSAVENNRSNESESAGEVDVDAIESRLGLGRRARRQQQTGTERPEAKSGSSSSKAKNAPAAKTWKDMSLPEKAWSVYIDPEKGVLFWLNKLAYGAIFAIIGAWIVFRFIGPALGWYQLDQPLLSPDKIFNSGP